VFVSALRYQQCSSRVIGGFCGRLFAKDRDKTIAGRRNEPLQRSTFVSAFIFVKSIAIDTIDYHDLRKMINAISAYRSSIENPDAARYRRGYKSTLVPRACYRAYP
jgi:hypothetical protein